MSETKIKNCPFCNGKAILCTAESSWIECVKCHIVSPFQDNGDEEKNNKLAIKYWNKRI